MGRLQSVQILRFVAAAMVVLLHASPNFGIGAAGVDIFFVISGFIIARASAGKNVEAFIADRVRRIYPIYWLAALPMSIAIIHVKGFEPSRVLTSLTLFPIFGGSPRPYLAVAWTLCFEVFFYAAFAVFLWRRATWKGLLACYFVVLIIGLISRWHPATFFGSPIIIEFGLGVLLTRLRAVGEWTGLCLIVAGAIVIIATAPWSIPMGMSFWLGLGALARVVFWGLPAAAILFGALQLEVRTIGRVGSIFAYLGDASYSIYLTHYFPVLVMAWLMPGPVAAFVAVFFGVGVHRYIEVPLLKLIKRKSPAGRSRPADRHREPDLSSV